MTKFEFLSVRTSNLEAQLIAKICLRILDCQSAN